MTEPEFELQRSWMLTGTVLEPQVHISYIREGGRVVHPSSLPYAYIIICHVLDDLQEIPYFWNIKFQIVSSNVLDKKHSSYFHSSEFFGARTAV